MEGGADSEYAGRKGEGVVGETCIPVKKQVESSEIQYGSCRYCGQTYQFETSGVCSADLLDEWASEKCDCGEAKEEKKRKEREIKAEMNIKTLFGGEDGAVEILLAAVHPIVKSAVDSVTVNIGNGVKATMKLTSKGKIHIKKTTTEEDTAEN